MTNDTATALHHIIKEIEAESFNAGMENRRKVNGIANSLDYLKYKKQVEYWQGKFKAVKHENNMLRKKFKQFQYEKLMQDLMNDPELIEAFQRRQPKEGSDDK